MNTRNKSNMYAALIRNLDQIPKSVLAALVASLIHRLGRTDPDEMNAFLRTEWQYLYDNGIVPQKPVK